MSVETVVYIIYGVSLCLYSHAISVFDVGGSGESGEEYDVS